MCVPGELIDTQLEHGCHSYPPARFGLFNLVWARLIFRLQKS